MNLFDETENKYFELVSRLLQNKQKYSKKDINYIIKEYLPGDLDFDVIETIFADTEGAEIVFYIEDGQYVPIFNKDFPIRMGTIEKQAAKSLLDNKYITQFLPFETIEKLQRRTSNINLDWSIKDIEVKYVFENELSIEDKNKTPVVSLLAKAIKEHRAIIYDNIRKEKNFEYRKSYVYPIRIEFSIKNDRFRISAYEPEQRRFIKMNLDTMENISLTDDVCAENLEIDFQDFLKVNTKIVILNVAPVDHVIERCFRVFSYYDRKARYDKEVNKYRLEISYLKFDEAEIIKDILSLGGYVTVTEPRHLQKEIYRRVLAASKLYDN